MLGMTRQPNKRPLKVIAPYTPLVWQIAPWRDRGPVVLLTGSAGGGKSKVAAEKLHGYCLKYPGAAALVLRKAHVSLINSTVEQLKRGVMGADPRVRHVPSKSRFEYANGAMLIYAGMEDDDQRERLRSIGPDGGIDIAWMEEATEFEESDYDAVQARLRGKAGPWRQLLLSCNPDAPTHWIYRRLMLGREAAVYYSNATDNTHNPADYVVRLGNLTGVDGDRLARGMWVQATGLLYSDVWSDGPDDGNVTEAADYLNGGGRVIWAVDDGYTGALDARTQLYSAESHPRVFLLVQQRHDGTLCVFEESYATGLLSNTHIERVQELAYPTPEYTVVDKSAAELKGRLRAESLYTRNGPADVEESIKEARRALALDANGRRRVLVHPRCRHLRSEMASYRRDLNGRILKQFDHGPDALRYLLWSVRFEE